jgi:1-acyl-sn-glycerol-3-phosphate acyltransferase
MRKGAFETGDGNIRHVRVKVGAPILPRKEGREGVKVADLRDRTHAAILELHRSIGGNVPAVVPDAPASGVSGRSDVDALAS